MGSFPARLVLATVSFGVAVYFSLLVAHNGISFPALTPLSHTAGTHKNVVNAGMALLARDNIECQPVSIPAHDQCAHVRDVCQPSETVLSIQYRQQYFCAPPAERPLIFAGLVLWLLFLFSTLGISASDFFTPNLATLARLLHLDDNLAGVTFLALGNGSPDLFSTFSAMNAGSAPLAIGELIGAATFIIACVVGAMCIIHPFRVNKGPFLRDVGFFTVAVLCLFVVLWDGRIMFWEAGMLVSLYIVYVLIVIIDTWWLHRREKKKENEAIIRSEYDVHSSLHPYRDDPTLEIPTLVLPSSAHPTAGSMPPRLGIQTDLHPSNLSSPSASPRISASTPHLSSLPSFSLVGALEFRQVVASLQNDATGGAHLAMFESPVTPFAGGHYHPPRPRRLSGQSARSHGSQASISSVSSSRRISRELLDPWDAALAVPLNDVSQQQLRPASMSGISIPSLVRTPASPTGSEDGEGGFLQAGRPSVDGHAAVAIDADNREGSTQPSDLSSTSKQRPLWYVLKRTFHILFPSLHGFGDKTVIGALASLLAVPAVLVLTLTLPVVVTPHETGPAGMEKEPPSAPSLQRAEEAARLVEFEEEGVTERALVASAEEAIQEEMHELEFNRWLMAVQCILGPLFCVFVFFAGTEHETIILLGTAAGSLVLALASILFAKYAEHPIAQLTRCSMGFVVAVVWIRVIADEVVNVLQTFGSIFGLSDAIIGLTIFAMGNSLADLVANMSVAVFAPIMGFSACFGGPMLNILLGVGLSGTFALSTKGSSSYEVKFSPTLFTSVSGLLALLAATLVFVPLNGYYLTRTWGVALIGAYIVIVGVSVCVELWWAP